MGHLREKYTKEYFTGKNEKGEKVSYGATLAYDKKGKLVLREHDKNILGQINFKKKNVLSLGVGRGEELLFAADKGAEKCVGVDFSKNAVEIARKIVNDKKISSIKLENEDALEFLKKYVNKSDFEKFDVVIMFDFVEHVPRKELREILKLLSKVLKEKSIIVINTPAYKFDNDVIKDGLDKRNLENCLDTSDINEATAGMHCNKFTIVSLQLFLEECGYTNITETHFFVNKTGLSINFSDISFAERWKILYEKGFALNMDYMDDVVEYPYSDAPKLCWKDFNEGNMSGISMYVNENYASVAYKDGNIDSQMIDDFNSLNFSKDPIIFDVGACVGVDAFVFAKTIGANGRVVSFEPNGYNRNRFFTNLSHNPNLHGKIQVSSFALSDKRGRLNMNISANIDGGHSSTSRIQYAHSKINDSMLPDGFFETIVDMITLDEFVEDSGIVPDVMKVDIEGAEHLMLAGAINTLTVHKPIIYMEIHSEYCAITCCKMFSRLNYDIFIIHEEDDNRLMIKAIHSDNEKEVTVNDLMIESQRSINSSIEIMKNLNVISKKVTDINDILRKENTKLSEENKQLYDEKKQLLNSKAVRYANKLKKYLRKMGIKNF